MPARDRAMPSYRTDVLGNRQTDLVIMPFTSNNLVPQLAGAGSLPSFRRGIIPGAAHRTGLSVRATVNASNVGANAASIIFRIKGNFFALLAPLNGLDSENHPLGCFIDRVAYPINRQVVKNPLTGLNYRTQGLSNIGLQPMALIPDFVPVATDLGPEDHIVEIRLPCDMSGVTNRTWDLAGYVVERPVGYYDPPPFLRPVAKIVAASNARTTIVGSTSPQASHNFGSWGIKEVRAWNPTGGDITLQIFLSESGSDFDVPHFFATVPAGKTMEPPLVFSAPVASHLISYQASAAGLVILPMEQL